MPRRSPSPPTIAACRARSSSPAGRRSPRSSRAARSAPSCTRCGDALSEALAAAKDRAADETGMAFCHPFDDPVVVAGQGTLGLELVDDVADLACVIVPLGGGGLASGTAIAVKTLRPEVRVDRRPGRGVRPLPRVATGRGSGADARRRHRRQASGRDHPAARRAMGRRDRRRRRGHDRRRDGAADGAGQALRRGRRRGRRGGVDRAASPSAAPRARRASCCRAATSTSASCRA